MSLAECDNDHQSIAYECNHSSDKCPMCVLISEHETHIDERDKTIKNLEADVASLEEEVAKVEEQLVEAQNWQKEERIDVPGPKRAVPKTKE